MTDFSLHNRMFDEIVKQHEDRIEYLKEKIESQENEIKSLLDLIEVMKNQLSGKVYDV